MDLDTIKTEVAAFEDAANNIIIRDDDEFSLAQNSLKHAKEINTRVSEICDPSIKAAHDAHKAALKTKKEFLGPLDVAVKKIRSAVGTYQAEQERIAREAARKEQERLEKEAEEQKLAEAAALEASGKKDEAEAVISAPVFTPPPIVHAPPQTDGVSYRENWKFAIENPDLVPSEYTIPDEKKIGQIVRALKANAKIKGVRVYCEKVPVVR